MGKGTQFPISLHMTFICPMDMRKFTTLFLTMAMTVVSVVPASARSAAETEILNLSMEKFRWKTTGNVDAVADLFDDELVFIHLNGHISSKSEWIGQMRSRQFVYHAIDVKETPSVRVYDGTAVLVGKATFKVAMGGFKGTYDLVYTEVYTKKNDKWKLVNLHTCSY